MDRTSAPPGPAGKASIRTSWKPPLKFQATVSPTAASNSSGFQVELPAFTSWVSGSPLVSGSAAERVTSTGPP